MYELNFVDTFSPIAKMTSVWIMVSLVAIYYWTLQLDIKNTFFNGILDEEVYMEQPLVLLLRRVCKGLRVEKITLQSEAVSRVWFERFHQWFRSLVLIAQKKTTLCLADIGWEEDHSCVYRWYCDHSIGDDKGIDNLKKYLQKYFQTKNLGSLKYF